MANTVARVQVNITLPANWRDELEQLARVTSVKEKRTIIFQDLIREAIQEKYKLKSEK